MYELFIEGVKVFEGTESECQEEAKERGCGQYMTDDTGFYWWVWDREGDWCINRK